MFWIWLNTVHHYMYTKSFGENYIIFWYTNCGWYLIDNKYIKICSTSFYKFHFFFFFLVLRNSENKWCFSFDLFHPFIFFNHIFKIYYHSINNFHSHVLYNDLHRFFISLNLFSTIFLLTQVIFVFLIYNLFNTIIYWSTIVFDS